MAIHEYPDLEQRSDEWLDRRCGMVTASVVGKLITAKTLKPANNTESRGLTAALTAERITRHIEPGYISDDMQRGIEDEPRAVETYSKNFAPVRTVGLIIRDDWGFPIGYSPDGLVGDDGLIEAKSRRQKKHLETIVDGTVPAENMAQLQCALLVSGRTWIDYLSFCGGMPMWVKRVHPDEQWFDAIVAAVRQFEAAALEIEEQYLKAVDGFPMTERLDLDVVI